MDTEKDTYFYFARKTRRLRYGDERKIEVGTTHTVEPPLELCKHGLHASSRAIDALRYAPGPVICAVELGGKILHGDDKSCATERTYLGVIDGGDVLREFARRCALDVIDLWDAPEIVREYLETGNEDIRGDAWDAVWGTARDAAREAAQAAVREAAWEAAWAAARAAARDATWTAAWTAARTANRDDKVDQYNGWLEEMIIEELAETNSRISHPLIQNLGQPKLKS